MEEHIKYNNAINFYSDYWKKKEGEILHKKKVKPTAKVVEVFNCPTRNPATVRHIQWAPGNAGRIAVAYCPYEFDPYLRSCPGQAYFWEVENPTRPEATVKATSQIVDVRYHPKDVHSIVGALYNGQVYIFLRNK